MKPSYSDPTSCFQPCGFLGQLIEKQVCLFFKNFFGFAFVNFFFPLPFAGSDENVTEYAEAF